MKLVFKHYKIILGLTWLVCFIILLSGGVVYLREHAMSFKEGLLLLQKIIEEALVSLGIFAPFIYIIIYIIRPLILFPTSILTPLAAIVFGPFLGWIYTYIGETIAACVAFLVARYFGGDLVSRFNTIKRLDVELQEHGLRTVLFLRLVPLFPFDVVNFGLGLTSVKFKTYVIGTMLGVIPGLTAYIFLGASLLSGAYIIPTVVGFVVLSYIAHILRTKNKSIIKKLS